MKKRNKDIFLSLEDELGIQIKKKINLWRDWADQFIYSGYYNYTHNYDIYRQAYVSAAQPLSADNYTLSNGNGRGCYTTDGVHYVVDAYNPYYTTATTSTDGRLRYYGN